MRLSLHARAFDLLVFSQTVSNAAVKEIMASAVKLHPELNFLLISEEGRQRPFGCATFTSELLKPDCLHRKWSGHWKEMTARPSLLMRLFIEANGAGIHPESRTTAMAAMPRRQSRPWSRGEVLRPLGNCNGSIFVTTRPLASQRWETKCDEETSPAQVSLRSSDAPAGS